MAVRVDIGAIVSSIAAIDVSSLSSEELARLVIDAERLLNAVHALSAVALEEFDRQGGWAEEGALSGAGWAAGRTATPTRLLRARVRAGAGLRLLPTAGGPARAGALSPPHLAALAGCARGHADLAARDETLLVEQARALDADSFTAADHPGDLPVAACDSPAFRVVLGAHREVLDVGRLTQTWPPGIRRAVTHRDGGCVFPGVIVRRRGATFTIAGPGTRAARPVSTTAPCSAEDITRSFINTTGRSPSNTANRQPANPTAANTSSPAGTPHHHAALRASLPHDHDLGHLAPTTGISHSR